MILGGLISNNPPSHIVEEAGYLNKYVYKEFAELISAGFVPLTPLNTDAIMSHVKWDSVTSRTGFIQKNKTGGLYNHLKTWGVLDI